MTTNVSLCVTGPNQKGVSIPRLLHEDISRIVEADPVMYSTVADFVVTAIREEIRRARANERVPNPKPEVASG